MTRLHELHDEQGQSPWLDNLRRDWLNSGDLVRWVERGVRGITSNPTIFQKAMSSSDAYDADLARLVGAGSSVVDAYWAMVADDIQGALEVLAPIHESSGGRDGFVSVEVAPALAHDTAGTVAAARELTSQITAPNLMVKIPATAEGLPAITTMIAEGHSINVTLIFGLERYEEVIDAYLAGLEAHEGDLSGIHSVASFFVSRVDTEVDARLEKIGTDDALDLRGKAAVAQAQAAYTLFTERFSGSRWDALVARGANVQRPLWASTSTKNPDYPDTLYVDSLIGPDTVNTLPDATLEAFEDHGTVARTVDADPAGAQRALDRLRDVGVDMADVAAVLEREGVASFAASFDDLIAALTTAASGSGR
ncbi:transaldolase [Actinomarinicola tropica]|uniref:Transaldolase n=1 Tax=Actinomarinicola tropica TaxID=2789776 RepID=A0A5Q2RN41_9ACTN|nr:transaldolase [Actinomarinicola tropica]QGG95320.1 transaldolase [Actinomarinicola tropica]